jgi:hypothetical protein
VKNARSERFPLIQSAFVFSLISNRLLERCRPWAVGQGSIQGDIGRFDVTLESGSGHIEADVDRIEPVSRPVLRQPVEELNIRAEQIIDGVVVLECGSSAGARPDPGCLPGLADTPSIRL